MEHAKKFFEQILQTQEAKALLASIKKPENEQELVDTYIDIAKRLGTALNAEDIHAYFASTLAKDLDAEELDDEELSQLTGGNLGVDNVDPCKYSFLDYENCWVTDGCDRFFCEYHGYDCKNLDSGSYLKNNPQRFI